MAINSSSSKKCRKKLYAVIIVAVFLVSGLSVILPYTYGSYLIANAVDNVKISTGSSGFNYPEYSEYFNHLTVTNPSDVDLALVVNTTFYFTNYPNGTTTFPLGNLLFDNVTLPKHGQVGIPIDIPVTSEEIISLLRSGSHGCKASIEIAGSSTFFLWNFSKTRTTSPVQ
jgi:hypothetical protein